MEDLCPGGPACGVNALDRSPVRSRERDVHLIVRALGGGAQPEVREAVRPGQADHRLSIPLVAHCLAQPQSREDVNVEPDRRLDVVHGEGDVVEHG
jgi:hypothetical protein